MDTFTSIAAADAQQQDDGNIPKGAGTRPCGYRGASTLQELLARRCEQSAGHHRMEAPDMGATK
eukprot:11913689-Heterocapsa_arctica.AAC.1